jgi:site-specific DNA recombinase
MPFRVGGYWTRAGPAAITSATRKGFSIRVCIYTRISTDEENQPTSLHSQQERLEAFCASQEGWRIVAHEEDRSTGTKLERPGLQSALELAREGKIDLLLVYRVDRLSRKVRQLAQLADELDRVGVTLRSATEPFDTGAAAGRMMLQMLAVFAEFEHATIVDRITAGIERRAKEGRWATGKLPFGYRRNEQKDVVPDEHMAPVVRRVFALYTHDRLGTTSIARLLTEEHAPGPARGWQPAVVQWVLENEAYLGRVHWRGQSYPGLHEPLVDEQTFARAQALLKERGEDLSRRRGNRSDFLLSGVIRCGRCKRAYIGMSARGNGGVYHYYACSVRQKLGPKACDGERLSRDKLEAAVLDQLARLYRDGDLIAAALETASQTRSDDRPALEGQRHTITEEIRRGERALDRYYQAFENGDLDASRLQTRLAELEARLESLREQDAALADQLNVDPGAGIDQASLAAVADRLRDTLEAGEPAQTKALLRLLIKELRVNGRSEILPTYRVVTPEVCATTSSVAATGFQPGCSRSEKTATWLKPGCATGF